mmetsp:Transcript_5578/g.16642  ORF Transcript_5578/g.16642 Transcript_5578/m.16642 type:complete len:131 (+) Transcript_5578:167-559(+)
MDVRELLAGGEDETDDDAIVNWFRCSVCALGFGSLDAQVEHTRATHGESSKGYAGQESPPTEMPTDSLSTSRRYQCETCKKNFGSSSVLNRHRRMVHLRERPFKCSECTKGFATRTCVKRHLKKTHAKHE